MARIVVAGAGATGASIAFHLASLGARDVVLADRGQVAGGATSKAMGGVRQQFSTAAEVRRMWGKNFTVWEGHKPTTWFYLYPTGDPVGAGVTFRNGRVTAVFTLGMKVGWRTDDGLRVGDLMSHKTMNDDSDWTLCSGYSAKSERTGDAVTSILTVGPAIYGFSLTRPSESVCR